jgi:hypothetical protein
LYATGKIDDSLNEIAAGQYLNVRMMFLLPAYLSLFPPLQHKEVLV